jgi:hypothetical protein
MSHKLLLSTPAIFLRTSWLPSRRTCSTLQHRPFKACTIQGDGACRCSFSHMSLDARLESDSKARRANDALMHSSRHLQFYLPLFNRVMTGNRIICSISPFKCICSSQIEVITTDEYFACSEEFRTSTVGRESTFTRAPSTTSPEFCPPGASWGVQDFSLLALHYCSPGLHSTLWGKPAAQQLLA